MARSTRTGDENQVKSWSLSWTRSWSHQVTDESRVEPWDFAGGELLTHSSTSLILREAADGTD